MQKEEASCLARNRNGPATTMCRPRRPIGAVTSSIVVLLLRHCQVSAAAAFVTSSVVTRGAARSRSGSGSTHPIDRAYVVTAPGAFDVVLPSSDDDENENEHDATSGIPDVVEAVVLRQVWPALTTFHAEYGHPNIPLGNVHGKKCETLRRLQRRGRLTAGESKLLSDLGFRFDTLEDIYEKADFADICARLTAYYQEYGNLQVPKKCKADPELGAWVAMVRRLGREGVPAEERDTLDDLGFAWKSDRKCGSSFMTNFRDVLAKLERCRRSGDVIVVTDDDDDDGEECPSDVVEQLLREDATIVKWIRAQRDAYALGNLSEPRVKFMEQLQTFGIDWTEI